MINLIDTNIGNKQRNGKTFKVLDKIDSKVSKDIPKVLAEIEKMINNLKKYKSYSNGKN